MKTNNYVFLGQCTLELKTVLLVLQLYIIIY